MTKKVKDNVEDIEKSVYLAIKVCDKILKEKSGKIWNDQQLSTN